MVTTAEPARAAVASSAAVRRIAFYLPSRGEGLFAWLHDSQDGPRLNHGVLICPSIGCEQVHSHRGLRHLADALARAGFSALRFDYHGTGDSPGTDDDPDRLATWLANVRDALAWLRHELGCRHRSAIGLRLGAALAAAAAAQEPVDQLVLWAPAVKGGTYVREMKALALAARCDSEQAPDPSGDVEAGGFVLSARTVAALRQLDLLQCRPRCGRLLVASRDDLNPETRLLDHLAEAGVPADQASLPGYAGLMAEPHNNQVPREAIHFITDWLLAGSAAGRAPDGEPHLAGGVTAEVWVNRPQGVRERVVHLREQPNLFGVMTEPASGSAAERPTVLMTNAGAAYRVAPSRLYVLLARALAARGFRCLRLDLGGLGDSAGTYPEYDNHPYPPSMFPDIEFALRHLQLREGAERVVLLGLCSGAYAAFQSAVHVADPALVESVVINPLAYYWREGMPIGVPSGSSPIAQLVQVNWLHRAARDPKKWVNLLTGKTKLGVTGIARLLLRHWRQRLRQERPTVAEAQTFENGHPSRENLPGDLDRAVRGGRRLAFFFGTRDPSHGILMFHAKRKVRRLVRAGAVRTFFIEDADHTFTRRGPRESLVENVCEYLAARYGHSQR